VITPIKNMGGLVAYVAYFVSCYVPVELLNGQGCNKLMLEQVFCLVNVQRGTAHTVHGRSATFKKGGQIFGGVIEQSPSRGKTGICSGAPRN